MRRPHASYSDPVGGKSGRAQRPRYKRRTDCKSDRTSSGRCKPAKTFPYPLNHGFGDKTEKVNLKMDAKELLKCYSLLPEKKVCSSLLVSQFVDGSTDSETRKLVLELAPRAEWTPELVTCLLSVLAERNNARCAEVRSSKQNCQEKLFFTQHLFQTVDLAIEALVALLPSRVHVARLLEHHGGIIQEQDLDVLSSVYRHGIVLDQSPIERALQEALWSEEKNLQTSGIILARLACVETKGDDTNIVREVLSGCLEHPSLRIQCIARALLWDSLVSNQSDSDNFENESLINLLTSISATNENESGLGLITVAGSLVLLLSEPRPILLLNTILRAQKTSQISTKNLLDAFVANHLSAELAGTTLLHAIFSSEFIWPISCLFSRKISLSSDAHVLLSILTPVIAKADALESFVDAIVEEASNSDVDFDFNIIKEMIL